MTFDREYVEAQLESTLRANAKKREPEFKRMVHEATAMEYLTGTPEWDGFLGLISEMREHSADAAKGHQRTVVDPMIVDSETIMKAKIALAAANAAVEAYDSVISVPKMLIDQGKQAKRSLDA